MFHSFCFCKLLPEDISIRLSQYHPMIIAIKSWFIMNPYYPPVIKTWRAYMQFGNFPARNVSLPDGIPLWQKTQGFMGKLTIINHHEAILSQSSTWFPNGFSYGFPPCSYGISRSTRTPDHRGAEGIHRHAAQGTKTSTWPSWWEMTGFRLGAMI